MQTFNQKIKVADKTKRFDELETGECFTLPGDIGFGNLWIGFTVFIKISDSQGLELKDGLRKTFDLDSQVVRTWIGSVEKIDQDALSKAN